MPSDTLGRRRCRAVAEGGIPGGCIPQEGAAWSHQALASGPCTPVEVGERSGTVFLVDSPLSRLEEGVGRSTRAAFPGPHHQQQRQPCLGQDQGGTGVAALADDPHRPDRVFPKTCLLSTQMLMRIGYNNFTPEMPPFFSLLRVESGIIPNARSSFPSRSSLFQTSHGKLRHKDAVVVRISFAFLAASLSPLLGGNKPSLAGCTLN